MIEYIDENIDIDIDRILEVENIIIMGQDIINDLELVTSILFRLDSNEINSKNAQFISEKLSVMKLNIKKFEELLEQVSNNALGYNLYESEDLIIEDVSDNLKYFNLSQLKILAFSLEKLKINLTNINSGLIYYNKNLMKFNSLIN